MGNSYAQAAANGTANATHTLTNLRRWSCGDNESLPSVEQIKTIHIYDFDNTLFASPLPNRQIWDGPSLGILMSEDRFANGGWWHDPTFLSATGEGVEKEEPRAWGGWWNEQIASLCELSFQQKDALSVLLTGRGEGKFADLIKRMVKSKGLNFDMVCLKPQVTPNNKRVGSTMNFKQELLASIMHTYSRASEIRIYEDRPPHVAEFRRWLGEFNDGFSAPNSKRKPLESFEVIEVAMEATNLDPVKEVSEVQRIINEHNLLYRSGKLPPDARGTSARPLTLKSVVFNTGYLLKAADTKKLIESFLPADLRNGRGVKVHADAIPIAMASAPHHILNAVGGINNKVRFNITATGQLEDRLWAVRVEPTNPREKIHTLNHPPSIVLALKDARTKDVNEIREWKSIPPHQSLQIETTVGEKAMVSIVPENGDGRHHGGNVPQHGSGSRKRGREEDGSGNAHHRGGNNGASGYRDRQFRRDRRDDGGAGRGRGKGGHGRGGRGGAPGRGGRGGGGGAGFNRNAPGYNDVDAGGGRRDGSGQDFYNNY